MTAAGSDAPGAWDFLDIKRQMGDAVYVVTGDDHLDDPAWGIVPVKTGSREEVSAWLRGRPDLYQLSVVMEDGTGLWSRDYLGLPPA